MTSENLPQALLGNEGSEKRQGLLKSTARSMASGEGSIPARRVKRPDLGAMNRQRIEVGAAV